MDTYSLDLWTISFLGTTRLRGTGAADTGMFQFTSQCKLNQACKIYTELATPTTNTSNLMV